MTTRRRVKPAASEGGALGFVRHNTAKGREMAGATGVATVPIRLVDHDGRAARPRRRDIGAAQQRLSQNSRVKFR